MRASETTEEDAKNPLKLVAAGALAAVAVASCMFVCTGCSGESSRAESDDAAEPVEMNADNTERFEVAQTFYHVGNTGTRAQVLVDKATGVQYLFLCQGYRGGTTVLLDADGKPLLAEGYDSATGEPADRASDDVIEPAFVTQVTEDPTEPGE